MSLKEEMAGLYRNIERTNKTLDVMAADFWREGGICCPSCGVRGYSDLLDKNERRWERIKQIETKLILSGAIRVG
jgi:hypothetical protein